MVAVILEQWTDKEEGGGAGGGMQARAVELGRFRKLPSSTDVLTRFHFRVLLLLL